MVTLCDHLIVSSHGARVAQHVQTRVPAREVALRETTLCDQVGSHAREADSFWESVKSQGR